MVDCARTEVGACKSQNELELKEDEMKKIVVCVVCALTLLVGSTVFAENKLSVTVSLKGWYNEWESGDWKCDDPVLMLGPSISVTGDKWFGAISYLTTTTDYEFSDVSGPGSGDKMSGDRSDVDVMVGYMFHPRVGGLIGYKYIEGDLDYSIPGIVEIGVDYSLSGPVLGITANYPIPNTSFALFGSLIYFYGEWEFENEELGIDESEDADGFTADVGIAYAIFENFSASIGYKYQEFEPKDSDLSDKYSGFTFSLNYRF